MQFPFISVIFIKFALAIPITSIQNSKANLPLYQAIYTVESNLCSFPFEYFKKVYYDCVPEFKITQKQQKILFFWCFYSEKTSKKLKKGYCSNESKASDENNKGNPLNKNDSSDFQYISSKNEDFQRFLQFFHKKDFPCKKACFEYLVRVLNDKFTRNEILRIKMEVYAKIQGFSNISRLLSLKKTDYTSDSAYNYYMFWTDFTLVNKLFLLFYNKEVEFLDIYSENIKGSYSSQGIEMSYQGIEMSYQGIEKLTFDYKTLYKMTLLKISKEIEGLDRDYSDFIGEMDNLQRFLHVFNEEFTQETLENITKGMNEIELLEKERNSLIKRLKLEEINISSQKALYYEHLNEIEEDFYLTLPKTSLKPSINCNKVCKSYFLPCFYKEIWVFSSCSSTCSFYNWDYNTLKCLKGFLTDICENKEFFSNIYDFCLLSGDFQQVESLQEGVWVNENPLVFLTENKEIFLVIDPFYLEFTGFLMKLHPFKSHLSNGKAFLYYPANKQRKSPIITVETPDFSSKNPGFSSNNNSILYMKGDFLQGDLQLLKGVSLMRKLHGFCEKPKVSGAEIVVFNRKSHVFLDLGFYFTDYPVFLENNWYLIEISGYSRDIIDIKVNETVEILLAVENKVILNEIDLFFMERLLKEGWVLIKKAFDKGNLVNIKGIFEQEKPFVKEECYWDGG